MVTKAIGELRQQLADLGRAHTEPTRDYERQKAEPESKLAQAERQAQVDAYHAARAELIRRSRQHAKLCEQIEGLLKQVFALLAQERREIEVINDQAAEVNQQSVRLRLFAPPVSITRHDWRAEFAQGFDRAARAARW